MTPSDSSSCASAANAGPIGSPSLKPWRGCAALRTLIDKYPGLIAFGIAEVYALRNDAKQTFEWLDRAWTNRDSGIVTLLYDPFILRYKNDPRFAAFCRKVGLPVPGEKAAPST